MRHPSKPFWPGEEGADPRILAYLDRLCEPLERTLNHEQLGEYRLQALGHLEAMAEELREFEHLSPGESVERALKEYGAPDLLAIGYLDEWCKGTRPMAFGRTTRSAYLWTFGWFGIAAAFVQIVAMAGTMLPGLGELEAIVPGLSLVAPVAAGILTGITVPTGNLRSVLVVTLLLAVHAAVLVFVMQPFSGAETLLNSQLLYWPPLGAVATYLTALFRRRPRSLGDRGVAA